MSICHAARKRSCCLCRCSYHVQYRKERRSAWFLRTPSSASKRPKTPASSRRRCTTHTPTGSAPESGLVVCAAALIMFSIEKKHEMHNTDFAKICFWPIWRFWCICDKKRASAPRKPPHVLKSCICNPKWPAKARIDDLFTLVYTREDAKEIKPNPARQGKLPRPSGVSAYECRC